MQRPMPGLTEFIVIIALLSSFVALSIDAMLPALPEIGQALGVTDENQPQLILSVLFLGMALGQLVIGPLSDSMGRKPLIYIGLTIFIIGCILSWQAENFTTMLVGRFLQGLGAASPRTITMALVRDCYSGRSMARIMSFSMLVFIMVPALAPGIGQVIIHLAGWRSIFLVFILLGILVVAWFGLRIPETLPPEKRTPLRLKRQLAAIRQVLTHRYTMGYTFSTGMIFGAFLGYLNSAQQILQVQYGLGDRFPLYFGLLALVLGAASFINAQLVMKLGMRVLARLAYWLLIGASGACLLVVWPLSGHPELWFLLAYFALAFLGIGLLFANLNSLAMEPLETHAGLGASVIGSLSTLISVPLGTLIGQSYNGTVMPLVVGFMALGCLGLAIMEWTERHHKVALIRQN